MSLYLYVLAMSGVLAIGSGVLAIPVTLALPKHLCLIPTNRRFAPQMVHLAADSVSEDKLMLGLGYRRELLLPGVNVFYYVGNYRKLVKRLACVPLRTAPRVPQSSTVFEPFDRLQGRQAVTRLTKALEPPRLSGRI